MGKSRPSAPPVPDPNALIQAQADQNRITQFTPAGNLLFGYVGDQGQFVQGRPPEGENVQSAAFTEQTPFQTQLQAIQEGVGLGLGNLAFDRIQPGMPAMSGAKGQPQAVPRPSPNLAGTISDPVAEQQMANPFQSAPSLAGISQAQDIDPTQNLQQFQQNITSDIQQPTGLDTQGLPELSNDPVAFRSNIEQTLFNRQMGLLAPEFARQREDLQQNLANRGIPITSEAYNDAINRLETQQGEQQQRLAQQATLAAGQEADRVFGQQRQARGQLFGERAAAGEFGLAAQGQQFGQQAANVSLQNAARQQQIADQLLSNQLANQRRQREIQERLATRNLAFNELAALLGGPQIRQPNFFAPAGVDVTGAFGLSQGAANNAYNQAMANQASNLGGLFGLAGSLGSAYLLR